VADGLLILKDRFQYTVVNGHSSDLDEVKCRVPLEVPF